MSVEERSPAPVLPPQPPRSPRRAKRRLRLARTIILVVLIVGAVVVVAESLSLVRHAKQAQASLEAFKTSLKNNDSAAAARHLHDADASLAVAHRRYDSVPLRVLRQVPLLGWPVSDAGRLLKAASDVSSAGNDALGLYDQVRGSGSKLFHNDTVSLPELASVTQDADRMVAKMDRAERQLKAVHAAFWEPSIGSSRDKALRQVTSLRDQGRTAQKLLQLAPRLVGADGARTYLVAVLNPAELQGAGGSALNMLAVRFDGGRMTILRSGSTYDITNENAPTHFTPLADDPWLAGVSATVLAAADRSPDFRTSGQELMRGYAAQFHQNIDGIIALDPIALQGLMRQIAPFSTPGYGLVTADNIVPSLLVDSYARFPNLEQRHVYNNALMNTLLHRILGGGHMVGKGTALRNAADNGHLQIYMNDGQVQQEVESAQLLRTLPSTTAGDMLGVYTADTNASKVDFWQRRAIDQRVNVAADGSVDVVRTVTLTNAAPAYAGPGADPGWGYLTRISIPLVSMYLPTPAQVTSFTVNGQPHHYLNKTERGWHAIFMRPIKVAQGAALTLVLHYSLPAGTAPHGHYQLAVAAQPLVQPASVTVSVTGPGNCRAGSGWANRGRTAQLQTADARPVVTAVDCR
jgi:hypothetical protein